MPKFWKNVRAQTAMELAVFGAVLIFVIGAIVRQAMSAGYMQNQYLRAMRQAMSTSYRYSSGVTSCRGVDPCPDGCNGDCSATSTRSYFGSSGTASHQTATILFVEDRLTADSAKYGAIDRTPYVVSASASYSRNLFLPVDAGEEQNLPVFDVFINGKHFPFTVSAFKPVVLAKRCRDDCNPVYCNAGAGDCAAESLKLYPGPNLPCVNKVPCPLQCGGDCSALPASSWEPNCVTVVRTLSQCILGDCAAGCVEAVNNCSVAGPPLTDTQTAGCPKLYGIIYNHGSYLEWCTDEPGNPVCPRKSCATDFCHPVFCAAAGDCAPGSPTTYPANLTADERFDLDRSGGAISNPPDVPAGLQRTDFSWQWYLVAGYDATADKPNVRLNRGAGIVLEPVDCKEKCKSSQYTSVDVDGDLKLEQIMPPLTAAQKEIDVDWTPPSFVFGSGLEAGQGTGVVLSFTVTDSQKGDLDMSRGDSDTGPRPGLTKDVKMFTRVLDGTYLEIEEGKLYAASGDANQYIRTTQQKDQIDLIERVIQLSNDTDRFCDASVPSVPNNDPALWPAGLPNPVEVCNDCWSAANFQRTCMAEDPAGDGTQPPVIYVRSRVVDQRGRKWVTNTSSDAYVDFVTPPVP
ncbi:MAG: hypothetical protein HZA28_09115 [Candidatus Omnitrophica bacterium]|nr:hypothetical protein [Candidatus Omnitrophota bacterium]